MPKFKGSSTSHWACARDWMPAISRIKENSATRIMLITPVFVGTITIRRIPDLFRFGRYGNQFARLGVGTDRSEVGRIHDQRIWLNCREIPRIDLLSAHRLQHTSRFGEKLSGLCL